MQSTLSEFDAIRILYEQSTAHEPLDRDRQSDVLLIDFNLNDMRGLSIVMYRKASMQYLPPIDK